jgi:preprotein translocase subunit SecG
MIYGLFLGILIITCIVLVAAILSQAGKGGGLAANFGGAGSSDAFMGSRQAGDLLTKTSWTAGGVFIALAFVLSLSSRRPDDGATILDRLSQPVQTAPVPGSTGTNPPAGGLLNMVPDTGAAAAAGKASVDTSGKAKVPPG